jgi:hypothetical protein
MGFPASASVGFLQQCKSLNLTAYQAIALYQQEVTLNLNKQKKMPN